MYLCFGGDEGRVTKLVGKTGGYKWSGRWDGESGCGGGEILLLHIIPKLFERTGESAGSLFLLILIWCEKGIGLFY